MAGFRETTTVIRTSVVCSQFLGSEFLMHISNQPLGRSPVLRGSGDFICFPMDQSEINNWTSIAKSMEAKGDTESWFYLRARAIADGKPDPMPNISELLADPA